MTALLPSAVVLAALTAIALRAAPPPTSAAAAPTVPPPAPATAATAPSAPDVLAAYRSFWDDVLAAAKTADPTSPALRRHATGDQLVTTIAQLSDLRRRGLVLRGPVHLDPHVISLAPDTATVEDCQDGSAFLAYDAHTGAPRGRPVHRRDKVTASLTHTDTTWKVFHTTTQQGAC
jgi:hypothetical protein